MDLRFVILYGSTPCTMQLRARRTVRDRKGGLPWKEKRNFLLYLKMYFRWYRSHKRYSKNCNGMRRVHISV